MRHSGDRRMSQQSTAWGGTAARAGFMARLSGPTELWTSAVLAVRLVNKPVVFACVQFPCFLPLPTGRVLYRKKQ